MVATLEAEVLCFLRGFASHLALAAHIFLILSTIQSGQTISATKDRVPSARDVAGHSSGH